MKNTESVFREAEFNLWAQRAKLELGEQYMISRYLDPQKSTLEAGAGGGRILLAMQSMGFSQLNGFDFLPEFIEVARQRDQWGKINYQVQDGRNLNYPANSFEQLIYLQQLVSLMSDKNDREKMVTEAFRVLKPGGLMIVNVLCIRSRRGLYAPLLFWLKCLRFILNKNLSIQNQPWLRLKGRANFRALLDVGPYIYWFSENEAVELFKSAGFVIEALGSDAQIKNQGLFSTLSVPGNEPFSGSLYLVCRKPL
jgi:ubiquinone/menaquinone biosynthesis C-methylase UbiE